MKNLKDTVFLLLLYIQPLSAQKKINWDSIYAATDFKEDSVQSFNTTQVRDRIVYPIQQSNANLEIRLYIFPIVTNQGEIWTLKFFRDTLIAEKYIFSYHAWSYNDHSEYLGKNQFGEDINNRITRFRIHSSTKNILDSLLKSKIFITDTYNSFKQFIKSNKILINKPREDCLHCKPIYSEINFGNKTRNFFLHPDPIGYLETNKDNQYLISHVLFFNVVRSIFNPKNQIFDY